MERVLVVGCSGAGKSTLARGLGALTGLPVIHLDQHYFDAGWREPEKAAWRARVTELLTRSHWIIDGNYVGTLDLRLPRADTVVLFDFPTWRCVAQALWRSVSSYGRTRDDMAPGCPEKIDWDFYKFIWRFQRDTMPRVAEALESYRGRVIVLKNRNDARRFLANPVGFSGVL